LVQEIERKRTDTTDCSTVPASAVGIEHRQAVAKWTRCGEADKDVSN